MQSEFEGGTKHPHPHPHWEIWEGFTEEVPFKLGSDGWARGEHTHLQSRPSKGKGRTEGGTEVGKGRAPLASGPPLPPVNRSLPSFPAVSPYWLRASVDMGRQRSLGSLNYLMDPSLLTDVTLPCLACHFPLLVILGPLGTPECRNQDWGRVQEERPRKGGLVET